MATNQCNIRPVVKLPADAKIAVSDTAGEEAGTPHKITDYGNNIAVESGYMEVNNYTRASEELPNPTLKLITVYTNDDTKAYKYNGDVMYDITDSGYTHNGKTYSKVYGYISTDSNIVASNITAVSASSVTVEKITYPTTYKMDVNKDGSPDSFDSVIVLRVANELVEEAEKRFYSDIYRKKYVTADDAYIILESSVSGGVIEPW